MMMVGERGESDSNTIFIRNLIVPFEIGVKSDEKGRRQDVRFNILLEIAERGRYRVDDIRDTVSYSDIVKDVAGLTDEGHFGLVEVLAERVAEICLRDSRVRRAVVSVEKLEVYRNAESVGITITRLGAGSRT